MDEFSIKYDRDEGTLRVRTDLEGNLVLVPAIQDSAVIWRDLSRGSIGIFRGATKSVGRFLKKFQGVLGRAAKEVELPDLTSIGGLGPSRVEDLRGIGIESVADLAKADPLEILGTIRGVGLAERVVRGWIEDAKELVKKL